MFRIGYFADGKWAHEAFRHLIQDKSLSIEFVCVRYDSTDNELKNLAEIHNIDYLKHPSVNSKDFLDLVKQYNCDLFVSMSFNQIFKSEIINIPRLKIINCHAGKLPFYRGRNVLNWVLINDENEFGITVHYVDENIDTGDIILQRIYNITDEDDYSTLLDRAYIECGKILYDAIKLIQNNTFTLIKQDNIHPIGMYCGIRQEGDEIINWNETSREVFNFIRAICKPGPMARSTINGEIIKINKARLIKNAPIYKGIVGQIVGKSNDGLIVKTKDSILEIVDFEFNGKIRIGDRFK
ncbi:methionyl-tRNA formyltransferase [Alkaliphilus sp. MSJ-5]|uniref:Methionyl-tRNA formyltransferase n=2 Tax=Alkaliphilus flagellatus TaxID=2841507 RepID=A0ABS6G2S4_9FIRM|nr:methionyl-tRNA formyltransferase [Alkaliphilus flagellatus]